MAPVVSASRMIDRSPFARVPPPAHPHRRPPPVRHPDRRPFACRIRAGPHSRRHQLPRARQRGARPDRHHLQAGQPLRGQAPGRGHGLGQPGAPSAGNLRRQARQLEAAGLLLARRPAQRLHGHLAAPGRLGCPATGQRLQVLSRPCDRADRPPGAPAAPAGAVRRHRQRQDPRAACPGRGRRAGAGPGGLCQPQGLLAGQPARRGAAQPEILRDAAGPAAGEFRSVAHRVRGRRERQDRPRVPAAGAGRAHAPVARDCARCHARGTPGLPAARLRLPGRRSADAGRQAGLAQGAAGQGDHLALAGLGA